MTKSRAFTALTGSIRAVLFLLVGAFDSNCALAQARDAGNPCGAIAAIGHYGPYDYRTEKNRLEIVERFHFNSRVENLISGQSGTLEGDLNYMLKSSPNHHRALLTLSRYALRAKSTLSGDFEWPLECYFERALRFRNDDAVARMIYAQYLGQLKRVPAAIAQLEIATKVGSESAFTQFNAGMLYFDLGEFDRALSQAHRAKAMGLNKPELEDRLKQASRWRDSAESAVPVLPGVAASAAQSPASASSTAAR